MSKGKESRRSFFQKTIASSFGLVMAPTLLQSANTPQSKTNKVQGATEWRNKQDSMTYRKFGNTGLMLSEIVLGTFPFNDPTYIPVVEGAVERGINYIDTASAYSNGKVESVLGEYLKQASKRNNVFVSTKLSFYYKIIDQHLDEVFKALPQAKQNALTKQAADLIEARSALKPGYHITYFGGQEKQFPKSYLRYFLLQEYGYQNGLKKKIKEHALQEFDKQLTRLQTDHVDVLHCPHGVSMPEMMDDEIMREVLEELKQKGKIRFASVSFHNDVTANLDKATHVGYYDAAMFAYNIANHAALENRMYMAREAGLGIIAMKVGKTFSLKDSPEWRLKKLDRAIPDASLSSFSKSYLWALQNPNLSACVSQMETIEQIEDNLQAVGKKVDLTKE